MSRPYSILRAIHRANTSNPFNAAVGPSASAAPSAPAACRVELEHLEARDLRTLSRDPEVAAIAPVMPLRLIAPLASDAAASAVGTAWGIDAVGAAGSPFDGSGVTVAVLDTGIDANHPAFAGVTLVQRSFAGGDAKDGNGHGTHCAGTIFGRDVGGTRIGVARGVQRAVIGKVLSDNGGGESNWLFQALNWAIMEEGARVISMSLGFDFPGMVADLVQKGWPAALATSVALEAYRANLRMFDAAMDVARARAALDGGCVVVAAAGNESQRPEFEIAASLPAAANGVISVGALQKAAQGLSVAFFSNTLADVAGPGVDIVSAKAGGGLRSLSGTSMATPHVAGITALWWQAQSRPGAVATAETVAAKLFATARTDTLAPGVDVADRGVGLVVAPS